MSYKVNELTEAQQALFPQYVERFLALGLSTKPLTEETKAQITEAMVKVYAAGDLPPPKQVLFFDSPMAALRAACEAIYGPQFTQADISNEYRNFSYGSQDASWLSYYNYFREQCPEVKGLEKIDGLTSLLGLCSFFLPYENICYVSANLSQISMVNNVLHSVEGPAWSYKDGFCGYSFFGTPVTEETFKIATTPERHGEILTIKNAEERMAAMRVAGSESVLKLLGSSEVDTKGGVQADGRPEYVLHAMQIEGEENYLLEMQNPSEPKRHYEFVSPEANTVSKALAWRIGWELDAFKEPVAKS